MTFRKRKRQLDRMEAELVAMGTAVARFDGCHRRLAQAPTPAG
jgi:hypothetical protein